MVIPGGILLLFSLSFYPHVVQKSFVFIGKTRRKKKKLKDLHKIFSLKGILLYEKRKRKVG